MRPRRRPGRLWLLFWGRQRRGFPGLLVGLLVVLVLLGLTFASRAGADVSYLIGLGFVALIALIALTALAVALLSALRRPGGR